MTHTIPTSNPAGTAAAVERRLQASQLRLAGQGVCGHGAGLLAGRAADGIRVWGRVARWAAAGSVGRYSAPDWPQAARAAMLSARTRGLTRIRGYLNMVKL